RRQPQNALRSLIRRRRIHLRAAARREPRPRAHGDPARFLDRGDCLSAQPCRQVLFEGRGLYDQADRYGGV
ncbi:hypothetical protein LTR28_007199, partial [Elasticomyces elasticus]